MKNVKRYSQTFLAGLLGLALLVGLNVLAAKQAWRYDATASQRYSLDTQTQKLLSELAAPVTAMAFYLPGSQEREQTEDLLELFAGVGDKFTYEFIDPDRAPLKAKQAGVTQAQTVVLHSGDKRETVVFPDEQGLLNAVLRVTNPVRAKAYFIEGHGELDPDSPQETGCGMLKKVLAEQGVDIAKLTLAREKAVPEDANALFILGPKTNFLDHELSVLTDYFKGGGRILAALAAEDNTNLDQWIAENLHIQRQDGFVVDPVSEMIVGDPMTPLVQDYAMHPITRDFSMMTLFPTACALAATDETTPAPQYLGRTTPQSWLETDIPALEGGAAEFQEAADLGGPLWLVATYEGALPEDAGKNDLPSRAVVFADQDMFTDRYINLSGNLDLSRNTANWLLEREELITLSKPEPANVFLMMQPLDSLMLTWGPLFLLPLACFAMAVMVALKRRRSK